jgi:hypothetical protein
MSKKILLEQNINLAKWMKFSLFLTGIILLFSGLVWWFFLFKGYYELGHFPSYGDPEIVSFDGLDRKFLIYSLLFMFWGFICWMLITISSLFFKLKIINKSNLIIGLIGIGLDCSVVLNSGFDWITD